VQTSIKPKRVWSAPQLALHLRRMGDKILAAFGHACEQDELEVAALLLVEYERFITRPPINLSSERRSEFGTLISAHARLWALLKSYAAE
jgi:hypothetical protein